MATFVAGTALLVWLAALISRRGVGSGIWILLLAPYLAAGQVCTYWLGRAKG